MKVSSPVEDPWSKEWKISFLRQNMKSSRDHNPKRYPYQLILKLDELISADAQAIVIERRKVKGLYAFGDYNPLLFYGFPMEERSQWIFYSIFEHNKAPQR